MEDNTNNRPKIAAFVCNWCSYAGADAAGTSRLQYDDSVRIIRLPCTGRIDPLFIVKAFEQGADGVLVSGCHPGDCHYTSGNLYARRRFIIFKRLMDFLGLDERRLQFSWVSAAEGAKWAEVVNAVSDGVKQLREEKFKWGKPSGDGQHQTMPASEQKQRGGTGETSQLVSETTPVERQVTTQLRAVARRLLESKKVGVVIGYEQGSLPGTTTPFFAVKPEETGRLVWNRYCRNNLTVYLTKKSLRRFGRVAVVAKGCDAKAIPGLIQENQFKREDVSIIGMVCNGVLDGKALAAKCLACTVKTPLVHDELIGQPLPQDHQGADPLVAEIRQLELLTPQQRWDYWQQQFARCVRCYACRVVCPFCYCETCIADKHRPQWIPPSAHGQGNLSWNIFRAMHLAGRCIGCDECARVCPAHIRLDLINKKLALEVKQSFGYEPGAPDGGPAPLTTFRPDDSEEFIR